MESTYFERPEHSGISEEEKRKAIEAAGLPEGTEHEVVKEKFFEGWMAQEGPLKKLTNEGEVVKRDSEEKLREDFSKLWADPEFRKTQYETKAKVTERMKAAHEKNAPKLDTEKQPQNLDDAVSDLANKLGLSPDYKTPELKQDESPEDGDDYEKPYTRQGKLGEPGKEASAVPPWADETPAAKKPAGQQSEKIVAKPTPEPKIKETSEAPEKAIELAKALNIKLPEGEQKPGAYWFEIKKEIANRLGIEEITSFSIDNFVDVPAKWINDLIRKNNGELVKYESDKQRIWANKRMEEIYLSQLPPSEEKEESGEPEDNTPENIEKESEESESAEGPKRQEEETETTEPEDETESEIKEETETTAPEEKVEDNKTEEETLTINFDQYIEEIRSTLADGKQKKTTIELPSNDLDLINAFKKKLKQEGFIYGDTRLEPGKKNATIKGIQKIKPSK